MRAVTVLRYLFASVPAGLLLVACATPPPLTDATAPCRSFFDDLDTQVARAGARDAGVARIAGYPYLRADRVLASFAGDAMDDAAFDAWIARLQATDRAARAVELNRLDAAAAPQVLQRVRVCGATLADHELRDATQRRQLRERVRVADDYAGFARVLGLYPLAVPFLNRGIADYHAEVRRDYAVPVDALDSPGPLLLWQAAAGPVTPASVVARAPRDALGIPQLDATEIAGLAQGFAPAWWIETGGAYDRPGWPEMGGAGPRVDPARPVVHYRLDYTRFGTRVLPALSYFIWFAERPRQASFDPYAGPLDGLVWRVVLDADGEPLSYDTIHACGCYRYVFPAQPLQPVPNAGYWQEPVLYPQDPVPDAPLALRVQSQTHYLRRIVPVASATGEPHRYALRPYDELLAPDDPAQRLFGVDGLVDGSERLERWWLWITGVPEPGAMRQWGRHATSFVGRSHFDDARFLEQQYEVPEWARP